MRLQKMIENEAKMYVKNSLKQKLTEKLLWNDGGVLFSIVSDNGEKRSLFVSSLEGKKSKLKELYYKIVDDSQKEDSYLIKCESIECKKVTIDNGEVGYYIFIVAEEITPLIEMVLEERFCNNKFSENQKKLKLLSAIIDACEATVNVCEDYPEINMFINNEQLCVDSRGKTKLLLLDMIKNDICINNQTRELKIIMKQLAKGLNIKLNIASMDDEVCGFKNACEVEKERIDRIEEKNREKFEQNLINAKSGNVIAWYNLGYMYEKGRGTNIDYHKAIYWYEKASTKKNIKAMNNLAHIYQKGFGIEKNYKKAKDLLTKAAKLGDNMAQFNLAIMYQTGKGVEKDMKKALYWYKKSMKNGNKTAERMYKRIKSK